METYSQIRARHIAAWGEAFGDRLARLRWSRAQIDAERDRALRALVHTARTGSAWHAPRLVHLDVDRLTAGDLTSLPTMTKHDVLEGFDDVVTDRRVTRAAAEEHLSRLTGDAYLAGDLHVVASGGSTGERGVFVYGWDAWIDVHLGLGRFITSLFDEPDIPPGPLTMGVVAAHSASHMTSAVGQTFRGPVVELHQFPVTLPVADIVAGLNAVQPVVLTAYASMLGVLAGEAAAGRLRIAPRRIVATSEPLLPELRRVAEQAFDAPVANCWGTSEGGVLAVGCWRSEGMHLNEDLAVIEPVDEAGRPVPPGERSAKVLLTVLYNPLMPLIRYELTDEVVVLDEPCPCGSAHRRVADVQGRFDDLFVYGRVEVHPHVLRSVLGAVPEILEYQVQQSVAGVDVAIRSAGPVDTVGLEARLAEALRGVGLPDATAVVTVVESLERHRGTGKLRRFVPLGQPALPVS